MAASVASTSARAACASPSRARAASAATLLADHVRGEQAHAAGGDLLAQPGGALGGRRLHLQGPQPGAHLALEVAGALELGAHTGELGLGPRPPPLVLAEAGRLLDEAAPLVRLGRQDLVDPALPDHRVHLAPEAGVGQELEHVQPAHAGAVDEVLALAAPVEPAHHRHLAELERQRRALVVEHELDLAHARPAGGCPSPRRGRPGRSARAAGTATAPPSPTAARPRCWTCRCRSARRRRRCPRSNRSSTRAGERLEPAHAQRLQMHAGPLRDALRRHGDAVEVARAPRGRRAARSPSCCARSHARARVLRPEPGM